MFVLLQVAFAVSIKPLVFFVKFGLKKKIFYVSASQMAPFRVTARNKHWVITNTEKTQNTKIRTHNLMNGGDYSIPDSDGDRVLQVCADSLCDGEKLFIVEQRSTPNYKLFFDIDLILYEKLEDPSDWYIKLAKTLVSTINELFDDNLKSFEMICSVVDNWKVVKKNQKDCYKYGIHITSPSIIVNESIMLKVRDAVVQKLRNNFEKEGPTTWEDDVDKIVYESSGFRMNFSNKGRRCRCTQKDRDNCDKCEGTGKVDEGRPYHPYLVINEDLSYTLFPQGGDLKFDFVYDILKRTSIRVTNKEEPNVQFNLSPPSWFEDATLFESPDGLITVPTRKRRFTEGVNSVENKLEGKQDLSTSDLVALNSYVQSLCQKKLLPKQYKGIEITTAFSFSNNNVRSNIIARIDSQYCMNIGREHTTNTVYMYINTLTKKAVMKCYCRCETIEGRRTIMRGRVQMCKDYSSSEIDVSGLNISISSSVSRDRAVQSRVLSMF